MDGRSILYARQNATECVNFVATLMTSKSKVFSFRSLSVRHGAQ